MVVHINNLSIFHSRIEIICGLQSGNKAVYGSWLGEDEERELIFIMFIFLLLLSIVESLDNGVGRNSKTLRVLIQLS